jgi:predicted enzyme related to lactoylglutathione lyase
MYFEVSGKDSAKLTSFYEELFEWKINSDPSTGYGFVDAVEPGMGGGIAPTPDGSQGNVTVYVGTPDIGKTLGRAGQLGGSTILPRTVVSDQIVIGLLADPDGHVVGLIEQA